MSYTQRAKFTPQQWAQYPHLGHVFNKTNSNLSATPDRFTNVNTLYRGGMRNDIMRPPYRYVADGRRSNEQTHYSNIFRGQNSWRQPMRPISSSPGSKLFTLLRAYGNTLYSYYLMEFDVNLSANSPKRSREYFRILGALNQSQIKLLTPNLVKQQTEIVETSAMKLSIENIKLQQLEYHLKLDELKNEIQAVMSTKIKYVPSADQVIKYIIPNMLKRRLHTNIIPKFKQEMQTMTQSLHDQLHVEEERPIHKQVDSQRVTELPPAVRSDPSSSNIINFKSPMNIEMTSIKQPMKRKNDSVDLDRSSSSTLHEDSHNKRKALVRSSSHSSIKSHSSYNTDVGDIWTARTSPSTSNSNLLAQPNQQHLQVQTIHESFTNYTTFSINKETTPTVSNPPDTSTKITVKEDMEFPEKEFLINQSNNVARQSLPHHGLITLVSRIQTIKPPPTHLVIEFPHVVPISQLQSISSENIIFEILMIDHDFLIYKKHLSDILEWCKSQLSPTIITLPSHWESQLRDHLRNDILYKIQRPFPLGLYPSNTT
jgi:hypothetical protein